VKAGFHFGLFSKRSKDYGLAGQQMDAFFYVYILVSEANNTLHYTRITRNLQQRLLEHNRGKCPNSSAHRPSRIETAIAFKFERKARAFEKYLKSGSGREFARRHF
jgi:putative endonuclease